jgi:hypothetical protein
MADGIFQSGQGIARDTVNRTDKHTGFQWTAANEAES